MKLFNTTIHNKLLVMFTVSLLIGCSQPTESQQTNTQETTNSATQSEISNTSTTETDNINQPQYMVILNSSYPPYSFRDEQGNSAGFDIDLIRAIGERKGFTVNFISEPWKKIEENINKSEYDLVMGGFYGEECYEECRTKYDISNPYVITRDVVATQGNLPKANTLDDLKSLKVVMIGDSSYLPGIEEVKGKGNPDIIEEPSDYLAFQAFVQGRADTLVMDKSMLDYYLKSVPDFKVHIGGEGKYFAPYDLVILVKKSEPELMNQINQGVKELIQDGTYQKIYAKWFNGEPLLPAALEKSDSKP